MKVAADSQSDAGSFVIKTLLSFFGRDALAFLMVGGTAALLYALASSFLLDFSGIELGVPDWVASSLLYGAFVPLVYLSHRRFSFRSNAPHGRALTRYVLTQAGSLSLATLLSYIVYQLLGLPASLGSLIVVGVTSLTSYLVLRLWTFAS